MKKSILFVCSAIMIMAMAGCSQGSFKRTKYGLMYKLISDGKNPVVKSGQVLKFEYTQKLRDSIINSSKEGIPGYMPIDSASLAEYLNPVDVYRQLRKGDSLVIIYEADTIRKQRGGLPPFLKTKDKLFFTLKVTEILPSIEAAEQDYKASMESGNKAQLEKDLKILSDYLKSKNITAQQAPRGTFVEITVPGSGPACDSLKYISVMYTGQTLAGKVFDSNTDPKFGHAGQPFVFQMKRSGAIDGMMDGLGLMKLGGKGRIYVPSSMGYGRVGAGDDIKPNENLIFDIEIVGVSDTRPEPDTAVKK